MLLFLEQRGKKQPKKKKGMPIFLSFIKKKRVPKIFNARIGVLEAKPENRLPNSL